MLQLLYSVYTILTFVFRFIFTVTLPHLSKAFIHLRDDKTEQFCQWFCIWTQNLANISNILCWPKVKWSSNVTPSIG